MTMNPIYRAWWRMLMDLRPMVRFLAERFPKASPWAVRFRSLLHGLIGNPVQTLAGGALFAIWQQFDVPGRWTLGAFVAICVILDIAHRLAYRNGGRFVGWREAWRFRRRWPGDWAGVAAKTTRVQAEVGTSKEPIASAVLRPIADHPKMSWWPQIEWPVVSWWVGPPPGRSLRSLDELAVILAANISRVADIHVDYERENDSHGRLIVSFDDVLGRPSSPTWGSPRGPADDLVLDDIDQAIDDFDQSQPTLRLIEGEAQ